MRRNRQRLAHRSSQHAVRRAHARSTGRSAAPGRSARPGAGGRLHDCPQAGGMEPALGGHPVRDDDRGLRAGWSSRRGVVNLVHGFGETAGKALTEHPAIKAIAFVGESITGSHIMVWVNSENVRHLPTPFGGVKASGIGRDGGEYAFEVYMEQKSASIGLDGHSIPRLGA